ncbi:MAG: hypothetical protein MJA83_15195, partial [Gammaproteobacteria bacterium]|nr:hypothetical protein [Gammaproteobacteria bacterium]
MVGEVARFDVSYTIEALQEEWSEIALPLKGVAVESVELSSPDALFAAHGDGYRVYLPRAGSYELKLKLAAAVSSEPGRKSFRFGIPATAVSRLEIDIPEEDIRVDVEPSLAVTQTAGGDGTSTRVLAFLGNSTTVAVSW